MTVVNFGIVGTGMIAGVVANSIDMAPNGRLVAVSSRKQQTAEAFVAERSGASAVEGVDALLARKDVDAVYVATPTTAKEAIALAAIESGKHVLVDKPFLDQASVDSMAKAAADRNLLFMDATHFVHHPRTQAIQAAIPERIGRARSLNTTFYFPWSDRDNIRFDPSQEPTGVLGDMVWYAMRAVVEYLQPAGDPTSVSALAERDPGSGAIIRVAGLLGFEEGKISTFDVGWTADTVIMDLSIVGERGMLSLDDFVVDWGKSFAFQNPDIPVGYVHRAGMMPRKDFAFTETPTELSQDSLMIEHFAELVASGDRAGRGAYAEASSKTQRYLDAIADVLNDG